MHDHPRAILLISSIPVFTRNLVWAAGQAQRSCWVMTPNRGDSWESYPHVLGVETIDQDMLVRADPQLCGFVQNFCRARGIGVVIAGDTRSSRFVLQLAPTLPTEVRCFPMCEPDLFEQMYDKWRFASLLEELGLPAPRTTLIGSAEDLEHCDTEPPLIIKPTQGEAGLGVQTVGTVHELRKLVNERADLRKNPIVVQSYVPGSDIDLSLIADRGRCVAWTIQQYSDSGVMTFLERPDVLELGQELVRRTGYHGVMHLDLRIDHRSGGVVFIESNPRFWGSLCYSVWSGVNFLDLGLRLMDGEDVSSRFRPVDAECPYLAVTMSSLFRLLLGGWLGPRGLNDSQLRSWKFHHHPGVGSISEWLRQSIRRRR